MDVKNGTKSFLRTGLKSSTRSSESHVRITKKYPINVGDHDVDFYEGFCEHSDYVAGRLPSENVAGGSNFIETDTGDWRFYVESTGDYEKRLTISDAEE